MKRFQQTTRFFSYYVLIIAVIIAFMAGMVIGQRSDGDTQQMPTGSGSVSGVGETPTYLSEDVDVDLLWEAWDVITEHYVDQPVSETELLYGALAGLVGSLQDPHSMLLTPDVNEEFLQELNGSFFGIGAEIAIKNNQLQVVAPLPDTPAFNAGLRAKDYILQIDELDTQGISIDQAVANIRGPKGTTVVLTVYREGWDEAREISIVRDEIRIESVSWEMREEQIAYIELRYFNADTDRAFKNIAQEIVAADPDQIILDLRNNPGGFLNVAVEIASLFIEDGVIVTEESYDGSTTVHEAKGRAILAEYPVIVLINEGSASASEILAGALKDYDLAQVIGMQSFGKGSVQTLFDLSDGSSIKLTIAKWLTPSGTAIEGEGITPDIVVDLTEEDWDADRDPQLEKAFEVIRMNAN